MTNLHYGRRALLCSVVAFRGKFSLVTSTVVAGNFNRRGETLDLGMWTAPMFWLQWNSDEGDGLSLLFSFLGSFSLCLYFSHSDVSRANCELKWKERLRKRCSKSEGAGNPWSKCVSRSQGLENELVLCTANVLTLCLLGDIHIWHPRWGCWLKWRW